MTSVIAEMFKHNLWSNLRLLDACAALTDEQLDATATGTYGSVRDTLVHLLAAEERYVSLLTGKRHERPLRESEGFPGFDDLRARAQASGQALLELSEQVQPGQIVHATWQGEGSDLRAEVPLAQAIHHGNEHRTNITTVLAQAGIEPPDVSEWAYDEARNDA